MIRDIYSGSRIPNLICSISDPESRDQKSTGIQGSKKHRNPGIKKHRIGIRNAACHRSCLFEDRPQIQCTVLNSPFSEQSVRKFYYPGYILQQKIWMTLSQQIFFRQKWKNFRFRSLFAGILPNILQRWAKFPDEHLEYWNYLFNVLPIFILSTSKYSPFLNKRQFTWQSMRAWSVQISELRVVLPRCRLSMGSSRQDGLGCGWGGGGVILLLGLIFYQCCGSGSGIRSLLDPGSGIGFSGARIMDPKPVFLIA